MQTVQAEPSRFWSWFTEERKRWLVGIVAAFLVGYGAANGHTTESAVADISSREAQADHKVAVLKKQVVVEKKKADDANAVLRAVVGDHP